MREEAVARRYAAALFHQAEKANTVIATGNEMQLVVDTLQRTPALQALLRQPLVTEARKKLALKNHFGNQVSPMTLALLDLAHDTTPARRVPQPHAAPATPRGPAPSEPAVAAFKAVKE